MPESIFDIKDCFVNIKDSVVRKPDDNKMSFLSMGTNIKRIYLKNIEDKDVDRTLYKLIIQYDDSIHVASLYGKTYELTDENKMAP